MVSDVIVVGAGVLGLAAGAELRCRGRKVRVLAPAEVSASALAAGMLAPAFESVLDPRAAAHADLLRRARDLWPSFAAVTGVALIRDGAEWRGPDPENMADRLAAAGFATRETPQGVMTPDDWRLDPVQALAALVRPLDRVHGRLIAVEGRDGAFVLTTDEGESLQARQIVLASGWQALDCGLPLPPIRPIKGQALRVAGPSPERVLRGEGVYVVPAPGGAIIGATMGEGAADTQIDPEVSDRLIGRARAIWPQASEMTRAQAFAGVRGACPDDLPAVGLIAPGVAVALGPRRNGWLLAPMIAAIAASALEGEGRPGPFDPGRFA